MKISVHKESWNIEKDGYNIEVCTWERSYENKPIRERSYENKPKWNIYIHMFERCSIYDKFTKDDMADDLANELLVNGCSYGVWKTIKDFDGVPRTTKTYGNDYDHIWNGYATEEMVMTDAEELIKQIEILKEQVTGLVKNAEEVEE